MGRTAVKSFSACTVQLIKYSAYGPYGFHTNIVTAQYIYTSTNPTVRTAGTKPQCL